MTNYYINFVVNSIELKALPSCQATIHELYFLLRLNKITQNNPGWQIILFVTKCQYHIMLLTLTVQNTSNMGNLKIVEKIRMIFKHIT